jgi:hypothetical protein
MMDEAPIVFIGGLGGSGTRAVAGAVANLGYYPGGCLNDPNDNMIFTKLFKQPDWLRAKPPQAEILDRLSLFEHIMCEGIGSEIVRAWPGLARFAARQGRGLSGQPDALGWMTKEPNCHIFLESILNRWSNAVFVYVVRHPIDMAFSKNQNQLRNWGWLFGVGKQEFATEAAAQLEYWILTQRRLDDLKNRFPDRVYTLRFDAFAERPVPEIEAMIEALALRVSSGRIVEACAGVAKPESLGRYRHHDLSQFGADQLEFCAAAGWHI